MKKFYLKKFRVVGLFIAVSMMVSVHAQETLQWKGTINSDASNVDNWDPAAGIDGNVVKVSNTSTFADPENPNYPEFKFDRNVSINAFDVGGEFTETGTYTDEEGNPTDAEGNPLGEGEDPIEYSNYYPEGKVIINMDEGFTLNTTTSSIFYNGGRVVVKNGTLEISRGVYLQNFTSVIEIIEDGIFKGTRNGYFMMGHSNGASGGKVIIKDNGEFHLGVGDMGRWTDKEENQFIIQDNGKAFLNGNHINNLTNRQGSGQLNGGETHYPHFWYSIDAGMTYVVAKSNDNPWIYLADRTPARVEALLRGEAGSELAIEKSLFTEEGTKFEWKYGTTQGGPYDNVLADNSDADNVIPQFDASGAIYLVCEVTVEGVTKVSNELVYNVAETIFVPTLQGKQYLRGAQVGAEIDIIVDGELEGDGEWVWTQTSGESYQSFDPAITGTKISPDFGPIGTYYIAFQGKVGGVDYTSMEIEIEKLAYDAGALPITWTGEVDDDFGNILNWSPLAYPTRNYVEIPVDVPVYPVVTVSDTIHGRNSSEGSFIQYQAAVYDGEDNLVSEEKKAELIIRMGEEDTFVWTGDAYGVKGKLIVESGTFFKNNLLRIDTNHGELHVKGTGVAHFDPNPWDGENALCFGNSGSPTAGGQVYVYENGKVLFHPGSIMRITSDPNAEFSKIHISDNGQLLFEDDFYAGAATYAKNNRFVIEEGYVLSNMYDQISGYTYVTARNLSDFAIENDATQYISINQASELLTLANVGELADFTWEVGEGALGPWTSLEIAGDQAAVQFETPGVYYVSAVSSDDTRTANSVKFVVVDFKVAVEEAEGGLNLSVELPDGAVASGWRVMNPGSDEYVTEDFGQNELEYLLEAWHLEAGDGEYKLTFAATLTDEDGDDVVIYASPALVTLDGFDLIVGINSVKEVVAGVYPNPNNGTFTLSVDADVYTVEVIDLAGNVISKAQLSGGNNTITLSNSGVYIVRVTTSEKSTVQRVIVK